MNKEKLKELLHMYVLDELDEKEREIVENHLMESDEYKAEYEKLKKSYSSIEENKPEHLPDEILKQARADLRSSIRIEMNKESLWAKIRNELSEFFSGKYTPVYGMAVMLLAGFLFGYIVFNSSSPELINTDNPNEINLDAIDNNELNISNIRFQNPFGGEGDVEINFDAVKPISYKGNVDDPVVQRLLAAALTTSDNPGVRIRTVNTIASKTSNVVLKDPKIKTALINALKTDENAGVRREALNTLMKYPYSVDLRDAFLFVLSNDSNPGIKVGAINALAQMKLEGRSIDSELKNVIDNELGGDENEFIKLKAASLIQEVQ